MSSSLPRRRSCSMFHSLFHPWRHWPLNGPNAISSKARHYAGTPKDWVGECWTHSCVRVLLIVAAIKACIVYMYGDLQLVSLYVLTVSIQVSPRWGVRDEEKGTDWTTWGLDCVPGLRIADILRSMTFVRPAPRRTPARPLLKRFAVGPASQSQPNVVTVT